MHDPNTTVDDSAASKVFRLMPAVTFSWGRWAEIADSIPLSAGERKMDPLENVDSMLPGDCERTGETGGAVLGYYGAKGVVSGR